MAEVGKCSHSACNCGVSEDSEYCSDRCRDAADQGMTEIACDCGHGSCG